MGVNPRLWASIVPRDPRKRKPNHYGEMARVAWQTLVAVTVMVVTAWLLVRLVAAPISDFGRPWR